ncbi:hypothetical protein COT30_03790 [Candidatus Micrarchaeota archaeon CG08_land_8_20_14_0_20_49_17]|nr:MAG: hypothetical protein COT30_03790 [Candidatus Micrarchaeota archaeon CG08_land_8_20_14_0_20_49_17]
MAIIFTYPLVLHLADMIPGCCDVWLFVWDFWWFKYALSHSLNPLFTTHMFYPLGANLAAITATPLNAIISIPLQSAFGLPAAFNLILLFEIILGAYAAFLLIRHISKDDWASMLGGVVYAFNPYVVGKIMAGHLNLLPTPFIPLSILFLLKLFERPNPRDAGLLGLSMAFLAYTELQYFALTSIFFLLFMAYKLWVETGELQKFLWRTLPIDKSAPLWVQALVCLCAAYFFLGCVFIVYYIVYTVPWLSYLIYIVPILLFSFALNSALKNPEVKPVLGYITISLLVFTILAGPFIAYTALYFFQSTPAGLPVGFGGQVVYSADLLAFILPSYYSPIFGDAVRPIYAYISVPVNIMEQVVFPGYSVLLLAYFAWRSGGKDARFWLMFASAFAILSLGGILIIANIPFPVPLPNLILELLIPFYSIIRVPSRFALLMMLSLAAVCALVLKTLKFQDSRWGALLLFLLLILIEYYPATLQFSSMAMPQIFQALANERGSAVLAVPTGMIDAMIGIKQLYYQTAHGLPMVGGYLSRSTNNTYQFINANPAISQLAGITDSGNSSSFQLCKPTTLEYGKGIFPNYKIKYAIFPNYSNQEVNLGRYSLDNAYRPEYAKEASECSQLLSTLFGQPIYTDNEVSIYQIYNASN